MRVSAALICLAGLIGLGISWLLSQAFSLRGSGVVGEGFRAAPRAWATAFLDRDTCCSMVCSGT